MTLDTRNNIGENTPITTKELLDTISQDKRIDGKDLEAIQSLVEKMEAEKQGLSQKVKTEIQNLLQESLRDGYSVENQKDYQVLEKMLKILHFPHEIPDYKDLQSEYGNFSVKYENEEFKIYNLQTLRLKINKSGEIEKKNFFKQVITSLDIDTGGDNNQIDFSDIEINENLDTLQENKKIEIYEMIEKLGFQIEKEQVRGDGVLEIRTYDFSTIINIDKDGKILVLRLDKGDIKTLDEKGEWVKITTTHKEIETQVIQNAFQQLLDDITRERKKSPFPVVSKDLNEGNMQEVLGEEDSIVLSGIEEEEGGNIVEKHEGDDSDTEVKTETQEDELNHYEVKKGERLWDIIKKEYGLRKNQEIIDKIQEIIDAQTDERLKARLVKHSGNIIHVGDKIILPK